MAEATGGGHGGLYLLVGGLVVAVAVIAFFAFGGQFGGSDRKIDIKIEAPKKTQ